MEENVVEAITNNVLGTKNVVVACVAGAVQTFVLISTDKAVRPGEKLYEEVFFGHEPVTPTAHPKVLRSPADPVSLATADLIETLIQSALSEPDDWDALRLQLRALVPDFHVPPPPPPADDAGRRVLGLGGAMEW